MKNQTIQLSEIAHARSGDKGNHANVAVIAYTQPGYEWIKQHLDSESVKNYFEILNPTKVERFEVPNVNALNFLLHNALGGGANLSHRIDSQGKALGLALLQIEIPAPDNVEPMRRSEMRSRLLKMRVV